MRVEAVLEIAIAEEHRLGDIRHQVLLALLHTPAPDLAAAVQKLELVCSEGDGDDHALRSILADARWIAARGGKRREYQ